MTAVDLGPLPGDPSVVAAKAAEMIAAADRMVAAAKVLRQVAGSGQLVSDATDALEENAREVATVMTNASVRYRGTGEALAAYAPKLEAAQRMAEQARSAAASTDTWQADQRVAVAALDVANPALDPDSRAERMVEVGRAKRAAAAEHARLAQAHHAHEEARAMVDSAARTAMAGIADALRASKLNDQFSDDFRGWKDAYLVPFLDAVVKVADWVATAATIAGIVMAFIPGLQPFAAVFLAAGRVMSVASFLAHAVKFAIGEESAGTFLTASLLTLVTLGKFRIGQLRKANLTSQGLPAPLEGRSLMKGMTFSDSARYAGIGIRGGGRDIVGGGLGLGGAGVDELVDRGVTWFGKGVDEAFGTETPLWSTDELATADVSSSIGAGVDLDLDQVMAEAFGSPPVEPRVDLQMQHCSAVPAAHGGGGW